MDFSLLQEGFFVMVIGMGTVFVFLSVMIFAMGINSYILKILNQYFPEEIPKSKLTSKKKTLNNDEEIALAIACAINQSQKQIA